MKVETKFNIGDTIYFMNKNKVVEGTVLSISINITNNDAVFKYKVDMKRDEKYTNYHPAKYIYEEDAYADKESLLNAL